MSGDFLVDPGVIDGLASGLRSGSAGLERLGGSVPAVPDAGEVSGQMAGLMSKLVDAAGEFSTGMAAAGDAVAEGAQSYANDDHGSAQHISSMRPG